MSLVRRGRMDYCLRCIARGRNLLTAVFSQLCGKPLVSNMVHIQVNTLKVHWLKWF